MVKNINIIGNNIGNSLIINYCLKSNSKNPVKIFMDLAELPKNHIHGPEHHNYGWFSYINCNRFYQQKYSHQIRNYRKLPL